MRSLRALILLLAMLGVVALTAHAEPQLFKKKKAKKDEKAKEAEKAKSEFAHLDDLNAELMVLTVLHSLQTSPVQVEAMRKVAAKTMHEAPPRKKVKVSETLKKTMQSLREALIQNDDEKIEELFLKFDELRQKENPEFEDTEITDAARKEAPAILRLLSASQVVDYLASVPDFPDPVDRLLLTMEVARKLRGKDWQKLRDDSAYQVGWLVAGLDTKAEESIRTKATAFLNKAYALEEKEYKAKHEALEKEARSIVGKIGPTDVLRNVMERVLAEMLSSYRLAAVLETVGKKKYEGGP
jgi:hypothetical protein